MPDAQPPENPVVTYDVKELIDGLSTDMKEGFNNLSNKLDAKADKSEIMLLQRDVQDLQVRTGNLETSEKERAALDKAADRHDATLDARSQKRWNWFFSACLAVAGIGGTILTFATVIH